MINSRLFSSSGTAVGSESKSPVEEQPLTPPISSSPPCAEPSVLFSAKKTGLELLGSSFLAEKKQAENNLKISPIILNDINKLVDILSGPTPPHEEVGVLFEIAEHLHILLASTIELIRAKYRPALIHYRQHIFAPLKALVTDHYITCWEALNKTDPESILFTALIIETALHYLPPTTPLAPIWNKLIKKQLMLREQLLKIYQSETTSLTPRQTFSQDENNVDIGLPSFFDELFCEIQKDYLKTKKEYQNRSLADDEFSFYYPFILRFHMMGGLITALLNFEYFDFVQDRHSSSTIEINKMRPFLLAYRDTHLAQLKAEAIYFSLKNQRVSTLTVTELDLRLIYIQSAFRYKCASDQAAIWDRLQTEQIRTLLVLSARGNKIYFDWEYEIYHQFPKLCHQYHPTPGQKWYGMAKNYALFLKTRKIPHAEEWDNYAQTLNLYRPSS